MATENLLFSLLSSACFGGMVGMIVWTLLPLETRRRSEQRSAEEEQRRASVRQRDPAYLLFETLTDKLTSTPLFRGNETTNSELRRKLRTYADDPVLYTPQEFRAISFVKAAVAGSFILLFFSALGAWPLGVFMGVPIALMIQVVIRMKLSADIELRNRLIVRRLPFMLDLLALSLQSGGDFVGPLKTLVEEDPQPESLNLEFKRVLAHIKSDKNPAIAIKSMKERLRIDEVTDFVFALLQADKFGSQLGPELRNQADRILRNRFSAAEKASHEAQVKIVFPGMIILMACLSVIVIPFIATVFTQYLSF